MTEKKDEKKNNSKTIGIVLSVLGIATVIWIIYLKSSKPDTSIVLPIIIASCIVVAFIISSFGKSISERYKKLSISSNKKALTETEVDDFIYRIVEGTARNKYKDGMFRNVKKIENRQSKNIEGDEICAVLVRLSYPIKFGKKEEDGLWIVINATCPSIMPSILSEGTDKLEDEMNFKSRNYKVPVVHEETGESDLLGLRFQKKTITPRSEKKEDEEEEAI